DTIAAVVIAVGRAIPLLPLRLRVLAVARIVKALLVTVGLAVSERDVPPGAVAVAVTALGGDAAIDQTVGRIWRSVPDAVVPPVAVVETRIRFLIALRESTAELVSVEILVSVLAPVA